MDEKTPLFVKIIAMLQILLVAVYFIYYMYIGIQWGFTERILLDLISDSVYLLLIVSSVGLLMKKTWSWWLTIILHSKLFLANAIAMAVVILNIMAGTIAETLQLNLFIADIILLVLFLAMISLFSSRYVRRLFNVEYSGTKLLFLVAISAIILYMIYFIIMILSIDWFL
ncbi:hypothetical protein MM300_17765 [Evansella sp. LMS18]|jgi:hypothetical protein|uniref:hypothetical protein n=1 Tax=Evansella sp. LMS18 TaxID=2924033 RepID=UPI0020D19C1E|nr:hypothetical protein [Evansella sp. LMS18]UTR09719.1 hypothetical protein MM300_17765 [Evansella sp. LMS18]